MITQSLIIIRIFVFISQMDCKFYVSVDQTVILIEIR